MRKIILSILIIILLLAGCDQQNNILTQTNETPQAATIPTPTDMFTDRDLQAEPKSSVYSIALSDSGTQTDCNSVSVSGSTVTITEEADYLISGSLSDGMIIVDTHKDAKLQLILDSVNIQSLSCAPLYIKQADKVVVTLQGESTLTAGDNFKAIDENEIDAAVYSRDDLTFNGTGSLDISCPAGRGISSKDDLVLAGGSYRITCSGHALDANDSIRIKDSSLSIAAGKDGIHAENNEDTALGFVYVENATLDISAEGDGISGSAYVQLQDGSYSIVTGGGSINAEQKTSSNYGGFGGGKGPGGPGGGGMRPGGGPYYAALAVTDTTESTSIKGIKAGTQLLISTGSFNIDSADDSLHANGSVTIANGEFTLSSGDDGIHADETLCINGGTITVKESYEGIEALTVQINGGDITLTCSDDGINAAGGTDSSGYGGIRGDRFGGMGSSSNGAVLITGGSIYMNASGDGIDANGYIAISGGHTTVCGPTVGDTAVLDYDTTAEITGGTFIGTGSSMMAQSFTASTQGVIALSVGNQSALTSIRVLDQNGNVLISDEPKLSFAIMIVSCPEMEKGESYTVNIGDLSESFQAS